MSVTDPYTGNPIPPGRPTVRCRHGHVSLPDSWEAAGNRCFYPGCDHVGDPIRSGAIQVSSPTAGSPARPVWAVLGVIGVIVLAVVFLRNPSNPTPRPSVPPIPAAITSSPNSQTTANDQATVTAATANATRTSSVQNTSVAQSTAVARSTARAAANSTVTIVAARTAAARQTETAQSQPATGQVTSNIGLRVRPGPGTEYEPPIRTLRQGTTVSIVGWNTAADGSRWWKIASPAGWVSSEFVSPRGCIECVPQVDRPPRPTLAPAPTPAPVPATPVPARPASVATNQGPLLSQEQNGWSYQYEINNTGSFALLSDRRMYGDINCYVFPGEGDARLCADGELHPGMSGRVAYRWDSNYDGPVRMSVHAHKIDTSCGDGIRVRVFAGDRGQEPRELGRFSISGRDYVGRTAPYDLQISPSTFILVMADIGDNRDSGCDLSRVRVDINRR